MVFHFRSEHPEWLHGLDQNEAVRTMKERLQRLAKLCESHIAVPGDSRVRLRFWWRRSCQPFCRPFRQSSQVAGG